MDKKQMEMLSVKNAIERMVQGYISSFQTSGNNEKEFFAAVERMVASFFVSGQIDNNFLVRSTGMGLEISFSTGGHCTRVSFILPTGLVWNSEALKKQKPLTAEEFIQSHMSNEPLSVAGPLLTDTHTITSSPLLRDIIAEGSIRVNQGGIEVYTNGKWIRMPSVSEGKSVAEPSDNAKDEKPFDPFEAYERAKKAVKGM